MRMLLRTRIPVEHGNRAAKDGSMTKAFESIFEKLKPEAAYFSMDDGLRAVYIFYDIDAEYKFLEIHEPLFAAMGGAIYEQPALNWHDIKRGFTDLALGRRMRPGF